MTRHFNYRLADWCFRTEKFRTTQLSQLCSNTGCNMDMVGSHEIRQLLGGTDITVGSLVPGMGATEGIWKTPFFPGMAKDSQRDEVQNVIAAAVSAAKADGVGNVVVFTGKNTHASRASQFEAIRTGFTERCEALDGQMSLVEHAEASGVTLALESLNVKGEGPMRGHADYLGWNPLELVKELVEPIGSPRFKLVGDVYHWAMQSLNPVKVIQQVHQHIALAHAAGMMGTPTEKHRRNRGEVTRGQVIDYPAVMAEYAKHFGRGELDVTFEYIPTFDRCTDREGVAAEVERFTADVNLAIEICETSLPKPAAAEQLVATAPPVAPNQHAPASGCSGGSGG